MNLILCQIFKIILNISLKKHETLTVIPPVHIYINRYNKRLVFKIKDGCKLELQTPETIKLFKNHLLQTILESTIKNKLRV